MTARVWNEPVAAQVAAEEGIRIADRIGDGFVSRQLRYVLGWAQVLRGDLTEAVARLREVAESHDVFSIGASVTCAYALAYLGDAASARAVADVALERASDFDSHSGIVYSAFGIVHLAAGNASAAWEAYETARERTAMDPMTSSIFTWAALAPLMSGDLAAAGRWADDAVSSNTGWALAAALTSRALVEIARGELGAAERDAYDALDLAARLGGDLVVPFALDCLAIVAGEAGNDLLAARLFGAAEAARRRMGVVRFKVLGADDEARIATVRDAIGRTTSTPRGRKARRCRSRRRSPTRSVVVANAGAPAAVGRR